jgi:hypothetical protein
MSYLNRRIKSSDVKYFENQNLLLFFIGTEKIKFEIIIGTKTYLTQ